MIQVNDAARWRTINGYATGTVTESRGNKQWLVALPDGRAVIVHEKSMMKV